MKNKHKKAIKNIILKTIDFLSITFYFICFMTIAHFLRYNIIGRLETIVLIYCFILLVCKYLKAIKNI